MYTTFNDYLPIRTKYMALKIQMDYTGFCRYIRIICYLQTNCRHFVDTSVDVFDYNISLTLW